MFVDKAQVTVQAGDGGNGVVSFRHEKFVDKGGPDGGDGGKGGDIILRSTRNQDTLVAFRYNKLIKAESGQSGSKRNRHGKSAAKLIVEVPVGTIVSDQKGELIVDLSTDGQEAVIARGGRGGYGNAHFVSSTRQVPRVAENGDIGETYQAQLELKIIADVGLVGLPNAGKSTFLASISNARPEIANYPFTTLTPHLGVVDVDDSSMLVADIPGLIEGASAGKGLGDEFLRHVERTAVLLHLVDSYQDDVTEAYSVIQNELGSYKIDLTTRPQIIVLTKTDGLDKEIIDDRVKLLKKVAPKGTKIMAISSHNKDGVRVLLRQVIALVKKERAVRLVEETKETIPVLRMTDTSDKWQVSKSKKGFKVVGRKIEKFAIRTNFDNGHGIDRLRDIMRKMGIMHELMRQGIEAGDIITIGDNNDHRFEY